MMELARFITRRVALFDKLAAKDGRVGALDSPGAKFASADPLGLRTWRFVEAFVALASGPLVVFAARFADRQGQSRAGPSAFASRRFDLAQGAARQSASKLCFHLEEFQMRMSVLVLIAAMSLLAGCAHHGMDHGAMSHDEMARHCQTMAEHSGESARDPSHHDPAQHSGMSHEEMQRRCAAMSGQDQQAPPQP